MNIAVPKQSQVTLRGTIAGLGIGTVILLSNFQFGLQTGWVSMMSLPAALLAFSIFKAVDSYFQLETPFTPQENVYVQSVAVAVATGPLAYGFIGIIPAIEKLLTPEEAGIIREDYNSAISQLEQVFEPFTPWYNLIIWGTGLAFFGVFFAIPLREEFIIRQGLKFPSGSATATLISVFHGFPLKHLKRISTVRLPTSSGTVVESEDVNSSKVSNLTIEERERLREQGSTGNTEGEGEEGEGEDGVEDAIHNALIPKKSIIEDLLEPSSNVKEAYSRDMVILSITALFSSMYTITTYFIPQIRTIPIFGRYLSEEYLINFTPSPAYVGQGIIMGFETTCGMVIGMILGWFILSPIAKWKGWAPGETGDWKNGSEGWIMWVSLSIMIADSMVSLMLMTYRAIIRPRTSSDVKLSQTTGEYSQLLQGHERIVIGQLDNDRLPNENASYSSTENEVMDAAGTTSNASNSSNVDSDVTYFNNISYSPDDALSSNDKEEDDESISAYVPTIGLLLCCPLLIISMRIIFGSIVPWWLLLLTIPVSLILSLIGVKSLGETDLNPVSGIGKLSQLLTALAIPSSRPGAILINLIVGAISEATAQQAGDLMQDLKTGYLLGGSPQAQFLGQIFGSIWGIIIAAPMYRWYDKIYEIPGPLFKIPTAVIWIDCARLVNGHELPDNVDKFVLIFGFIFLVLSLIRGLNKGKNNRYSKYTDLIPSGVAVGIGIYNTPSFTLARFVGGLISMCWVRRLKNRSHSQLENGKVTLIIFSSGLVLGEGMFSVVNMIMTSFGVPHL